MVEIGTAHKCVYIRRGKEKAELLAVYNNIPGFISYLCYTDHFVYRELKNQSDKSRQITFETSCNFVICWEDVLL